MSLLFYGSCKIVFNAVKSAYAGLEHRGAFPSPRARAAVGMRVTEVWPRSEPTGEASSEAGWHI